MTVSIRKVYDINSLYISLFCIGHSEKLVVKNIAGIKFTNCSQTLNIKITVRILSER